MNQQAKDHYYTLSKFDKELDEQGIPKNERAEFWRSLDNALANDLLSRINVTQPERSAILNSLDYCRELKKIVSPTMHVVDNIYELMLLTTNHWVEEANVVYRGHANSRWQLIPSWYRSAIERDIQLYETAINSRYKAIEKKLLHLELNLSPLEREAIVQHYGSGTLLLDFTFSYRIAAFFATFTIGTPRGKLGQIYFLKTDHFASHNLSLLTADQVPDDFIRIHTTKSCFLQGWERGTDFQGGEYRERNSGKTKQHKVSLVGRLGLNDPNRYALEAIYIGLQGDTWEYSFKQTDEVFNDPVWGVSQEQLDY